MHSSVRYLLRILRKRACSALCNTYKEKKSKKMLTNSCIKSGQELTSKTEKCNWLLIIRQAPGPIREVVVPQRISFTDLSYESL